MTHALPRFTLRRLSATDVATYGNLEDAEGRKCCA
jgi:hypothetical protein